MSGRYLLPHRAAGGHGAAVVRAWTRVSLRHLLTVLPPLAPIGDLHGTKTIWNSARLDEKMPVIDVVASGGVLRLALRIARERRRGPSSCWHPGLADHGSCPPPAAPICGAMARPATTPPPSTARPGCHHVLVLVAGRRRPTRAAGLRRRVGRLLRRLAAGAGGRAQIEELPRHDRALGLAILKHTPKWETRLFPLQVAV